MLNEGLHRFVDESRLYHSMLKPEEGESRVGVRLTDTGEVSTIVLGEEITVVMGLDEPHVVLTMESTVFRRLLAGEADFALIGRSKASDIRPINLEFPDPSKMLEAWRKAKPLMNFFFSPGLVKSKTLSPEFAGEAHGAHPIPLVYWDGLRSSWYHVPRGTVLNEAGEADPYPQLFVILEGGGRLVLDEEAAEVETGRAYYVPPNSVHMVEAETDMRLIWIAWDTPP
ncbi:MAG TPA: cupin domain-containing protein [Candidatus Krumholzibacteriaceae bacterium]|nr:cupin domain-containing protein [Candidatus Krumholzibacteriaceae bacterium]